MPDLKPCPFCGGKDSGILTTSYDGYWFAVFCENCMAQTRKCRQEKDAVEAWNRRAGERKEGTVMDVRGKLVELLDNAIIDSDDNYGFPNTNQVADHLISNGVTVQGWISIDDMLPEIPEGWTETPEPVLYMMKNTKTIYAGYYGEGGVWKDKYFRQYADSRNGVDADDVLCWMYQHDLPQPPKGE